MLTAKSVTQNITMATLPRPRILDLSLGLHRRATWADWALRRMGSQSDVRRGRGAEDDERDRRRARCQEGCHCVGCSQHPIDHPRLTAHLRGVPAGEDSNEGQGEAEKDKPKQETVSLDAIFKAQVGSQPRK